MAGINNSCVGCVHCKSFYLPADPARIAWFSCEHPGQIRIEQVDGKLIKATNVFGKMSYVMAGPVPVWCPEEAEREAMKKLPRDVCHKCGTKLHTGDRYCPHCGTTTLQWQYKEE